MICVGKNEIEYLREKLGKELECTRTMVAHSNRHKYYVAETRLTLSALKKYWDEKISEHYE